MCIRDRGYSSQCEILEFGLVGGASYEEVPARLTAAMPEGIVCLLYTSSESFQI